MDREKLIRDHIHLLEAYYESERRFIATDALGGHVPPDKLKSFMQYLHCLDVDAKKKYTKVMTSRRRYYKLFKEVFKDEVVLKKILLSQRRSKHQQYLQISPLKLFRKVLDK